MTDITICPSKDALVTYLYEEDDASGRQHFEAHLSACQACRDEVAGFRRVRGRLAEWTAPELDAHVALVPAARVRAFKAPWAWLFRPAFAVPVAAVLVLAAAAGLANLEVRYDPRGLVVRTGWATSPRSDEIAAGRSAPVAPWRGDLAALERQLRQEFRSAPSAALGSTVLPVRSSGGARTVDAATLRQLQALIDEAEVRQQRNLALRIAELARDFDLQRKADLVQIQQGFGRLEGRTEVEAARAREMMNYIVRVSQGQTQPR